MISITKLLFAREYYGDSLRYHNSAHKAKNGTSESMGPVVVWNSTKTCNLKCRHCYMSSDAQKYQNELTTEEAKRFIDDLAEFKVPVLLFSGGEPLIRPDFFELAEYAKEEDKIGRIQLIRRSTDAGGTSRFRRLELTDLTVREKVLRAFSDDELAHIFDTDGFFE